MSGLSNPFPGPQPYRASDRDRFFGREEMAYHLEGFVLANACVTVHGPSGAGKSSLVQAAVLPALIEKDDIRVVRIDGWPEDQDPTIWLADTVYDALGLGERPAELAPADAVIAAAQRAAKRSSRIVLVYLDQMEQLLYAGRNAKASLEFFECLNRLVELPIRNLRVVLSLREDYLGRFRDRLRDQRRVLDHGFRVGPLTVADLCQAVCQAAAAGEPSQTWEPEAMRSLMLQVRVPGQAESDEAEAQSAYAQIVCRALFQERAQAGSDKVGAGALEAEAEPILRRYFEATLDSLGDLRESAQQLLEGHLVTADGSRTLRTEKELLRVMPAARLEPILAVLERAAILHAEEHQGSRYFEIGHDWLARKVFEQRQQREREEEENRRAREQEEASRAQRAEAEARLAKARKQRRSYGAVAGIAVGVAAVAIVGGVWAFDQRSKARDAEQEAKEAGRLATEASLKADRKAIEASDARLLAGFRELKNSGQLAFATKLLPRVRRPAAARGWVGLASEALRASALDRTVGERAEGIGTALWSPDGRRILTSSADGKVRISSADGSGQAVVFPASERPTLLTAWSRDGKRVLTASDDGAVRLWSADGTGQPVVLGGPPGPVLAASFSPDGARVLVVAQGDTLAHVWNADGSGPPAELRGHTGPLTAAVFLPDGARVLTSSIDGTARLWSASGGASIEVFKGHKGEVRFVAPSPDGESFVSTSSDATARIWAMSGKGKPVVLEGHQGSVEHAAWSPDGKRVATASADRSLRIWNADGKGEVVVLEGHHGAVSSVAFRSDGRYVASTSADRTARLWPAEGGEPMLLGGPEAPVRFALFSPDGTRVLTSIGAQDKGRIAGDPAARIWRTTLLDSLPRARVGFFHSVSFGPGAKFAVSACDDKRARLFPLDGKGATVIFEGHKEWVTSAALSPDGKRVVTTSFDGTARLWSADGAFERELAGHTGPARAAAFSPDGARVVTVSDDKTARVWSVDGKGDSVLLGGHEDGLTAASFSRDGQRIVTSSLDGTARLWRADGSFERVLAHHGAELYAVAWSPVDGRIVTASEDGTAQVWDTSSAAPPVVLEHRSPVLVAVWSRDGKRIATSTADGRVRVWSADGRGEPITLDGRVPMLSLVFAEDGKTLTGVGTDDATITWTLDIDALRAGLASSNTDCLPVEMRVTYFGESGEEAEKALASCEAARGHVEPDPLDHEAEAADEAAAEPPRRPRPPPDPAGKPFTNGAGDHRITLFVLPGDARVELEGKPIRRRDGMIDFLVPPGPPKTLMVSRGLTGTAVAEKSVLLQGAGAKPEEVDLNKRTPGSGENGDAGGKHLHAGFNDE